MTAEELAELQARVDSLQQRTTPDGRYVRRCASVELQAVSEVCAELPRVRAERDRLRVRVDELRARDSHGSELQHVAWLLAEIRTLQAQVVELEQMPSRVEQMIQDDTAQV